MPRARTRRSVRAVRAGGPRRRGWRRWTPSWLPIERRLGRPPARQAGHHPDAGAVPAGELVRRAGEVAGLVLLGQRRPPDRTGVVVERDHRIELVLRGRRAADRADDVGRVALHVLFEPGVALLPGPHDAPRDAGPGGAPADRPRVGAGSGIGIGLE